MVAHNVDVAGDNAANGASVAPSATHTPGPWEYIPGTEHHGAYVSGPFGGDICDCYAMSDPSSLSARNGGTSQPIPFRDAEANARLISAAPELLAVVEDMRRRSGWDHPNNTVGGLTFYMTGEHYNRICAAILKATGGL